MRNFVRFTFDKPTNWAFQFWGIMLGLDRGIPYCMRIPTNRR